MRNVSRADLRLIAHQRAVALGHEADAVAQQQVQAFLFKQGGYCTCCDCEQDDDNEERD